MRIGIFGIALSIFTAIPLMLACGGQVTAGDECGTSESNAAEPFTGQCLDKEMPVILKPEPHVNCRVFRVFGSDSDLCSCDAAGYGFAPDVNATVYQRLRERGICGSDHCCSQWCFCELLQYSGLLLDQCLSDPIPPGQRAGWCYVDPSQGAGSEDALDSEYCERELRVVPLVQPFSGVLACEN